MIRVKNTTLIVIPAYNAERTLPELLTRLGSEYPDLSVLVVNDGSSDSTAQIALDSGVEFISNSMNRGKGAALLDGFRWAKSRGYTRVVTMDADLQHDPADLSGLLSRNDCSQDSVTVGSRVINWTTTPVLRVLSNKFSSFLLSLFSGARIPDAQCGFRVVPLRLVSDSARETGYMFESESLLAAAKSYVPITSARVRTIYRDEKSHMRAGLETLRFLRTLWRGLWL